MAYQAAHGLTVNGLVDGDTWTQMYPPAGPEFRTLTSMV